MNYQAFAGLVGNASILLALALIYDFVSEKTFSWKRIAPLIIGILIGIVGIVVMTSPWRMSEDVIFDTRSILLSTTGLFFGFIPTAIAVVMTSVYRVYLGGAGVLSGVLTITTSSFIGLVWRWFSRKRFSDISIQELYLFGITVHLNMFLCMSALPDQARSSFFSEIALPVIIIYPVASMLLGKLLLQQKERAGDKKAIEKEKEILSVTLNSIGDAVIATDIEGRITVINKIAEKISGWPANLATGKFLSEVFYVVDEKNGKRLENPVNAVIKSGRTINLPNHTILISRDDRRYIIEDSASPIKDKDKIIGVVLVFRDVTEKSKLSEKLRNAEKLESLGVMAGGIAHDFNNLLAGIYGNVELALAKSDSKEVNGYLQSALNVFVRAKELTRQLLTFSKGGSPELRAGDLEPVIKDAALFALSGTSSVCDFDLPDDMWNAKFDKNQISDVIHNLVLNAVQAMPMGGAISISGQNIMAEKSPALKLAPGRYVKISVKDSGAGISKEDMSKVFDPFFTTKKGGTGLGLPTCFSILQKHNGTIEVDSDFGNGSIFSIFIPATKGKEIIADEQLSQSHAVFGDGRKILVMDDEYFIREVLGSMLEQLGFSVDKANDGASAIQKIRKIKDKKDQYFACFLDLTVPGGMGGLEASKIIKDYNSEIRLFASSGYSEDAVMVDPQKFGFSGSIRKPFKIMELKEFLSLFIKD
ncbi:MAG TPA: LytS/YhcK type 5TM receptor domain-containing protein [bacterium]|nr:LytS/YhcK type 5TM receptor domain-containing protein [bacterium]HPS29232.1 LytS/YhcK type 5TM receptor domain-containing protein [bacterium]